MVTARTPAVFIHGLWLHSQSWNNWIELFRATGYEPIAPSWPGIPATVEQARAHPESIGGYSITDAADHYAGIIHSLASKPIVIGHSFGGLLAQILLGRGLASAAIAIDAAPIKGVLPLPFSSLRVAFVALKSPANAKRAVSLTANEFRYGFGNAVSAEESADLYRRWTIPGQHYEPSFTSKISSATSPCASRWTFSAASLLGASTRQKIFPLLSSSQYLRYLTPYFPPTLRSFIWASATSLAFAPGT